MGFIKKVAAKPEELVPDPITGNLPTSRPTPKIAAQGTAVVILTALAPIITAVLAKRNIRMEPGELVALVTALIGGAGAVVTAIGYFKKNRTGVRAPKDASSAT